MRLKISYCHGNNKKVRVLEGLPKNRENRILRFPVPSPDFRKMRFWQVGGDGKGFVKCFIVTCFLNVHSFLIFGRSIFIIQILENAKIVFLMIIYFITLPCNVIKI